MSNPNFLKRQKEKARQDKQREKEAERARRKNEKASAQHESGVDPDIAGIIPGPQPPAED